MATVSGVRSTGNINTDRVDTPFDKKIAFLQDDSAPLCKLTRILKAEVKTAPEFKHTEKELIAKSDTTTQAETAGAVNIHVNYPLYFRDGDVVKVPRTGEVMEVTADGVHANGYIVVTRGFGSSTNVALNNKEELLLIGPRNAQGADIRTILTAKTVTVSQYMQIIRTPFGITNTAKVTKMVDQPDLPQVRRESLITHLRSIEFAFWFGEGHAQTTDTVPDQTMYGILERITSNVTILASPGYLTKSVWDDFLRGTFRYGSTKRTVFVSMIVAQAINGFAEAQLQVVQGARKYGLHIVQYVCPFGTIYLVTHKEFEGPTYQGMAVALDMEDGCVKFCHMPGRDTKLLKNRQGNGEDQVKEEYLTECAPKFKEEKRHSKLLGVTA